jgi:short subunit dehydrogenase-like uncharacterized protein
MDNRASNNAGDRQAVAVYGAAGHTGRFVVRELCRRGVTPIAIGRDAAKLAAAGLPGGVRREVASLDDPAALDRALLGADGLVNCAGPFLDTAEALVAAALRARIPYADVTAEQASAQAIFEQYSAAADEAGIAVIPAMGFYGGLADLLTTAALDSWHPTAGTRATGRRNTARRLTLSGGSLRPLDDPAPARSWTFGEPFGAQEMIELPFTEAILIGRHLRVASLHTYLNIAPLRDLRDASTPPPEAADESGRSAQRFLVEAEVHRGGMVRQASVCGRDIYAMTAPLVVEAICRVLRSGMPRGGVFAPGAVFAARDFLAALKLGLSFDSGKETPK